MLINFNMDIAGTSNGSPLGGRQGKKSRAGKSPTLPLPPSRPLSMPLPPSPSISQPPSASPELHLPSAHEALPGSKLSSTDHPASEAKASAAEAAEGRQDGLQSAPAEAPMGSGLQQQPPKLSKKQAKRAAQAAQAARAASASSASTPVYDKADLSPSLSPVGSPVSSTAAAAGIGQSPDTVLLEPSAGSSGTDGADNMFAALALNGNLEDPSSAHDLLQLPRQGLDRPEIVKASQQHDKHATPAHVEHAHDASKAPQPTSAGAASGGQPSALAAASDPLLKSCQPGNDSSSLQRKAMGSAKQPAMRPLWARDAQQQTFPAEMPGGNLPRFARNRLGQSLSSPYQPDIQPGIDPQSMHDEAAAERWGTDRARAAPQHQHGNIHSFQPQSQSNEPVGNRGGTRLHVQRPKLAYKSPLPASEAGRPAAEAVPDANDPAANHRAGKHSLEQPDLHAGPAAVAAAAVAAGKIAQRRQPTKVLTIQLPQPPPKQPRPAPQVGPPASQDRLPGANLHNKVSKLRQLSSCLTKLLFGAKPGREVWLCEAASSQPDKAAVPCVLMI